MPKTSNKTPKISKKGRSRVAKHSLFGKAKGTFQSEGAQAATRKETAVRSKNIGSAQRAMQKRQQKRRDSHT